MLEQDGNKITYNIDELIKNNPHYKGYIYDSLMYRYIRAREAMAELESIKYHLDKEHTRKFAQRDLCRFSEILNEVIGEHD